MTAASPPSAAAPPDAPAAGAPPLARVASIQYLRAVAALAVVGLHAGSRVEAHLPSALAGGLHLGHAGVDLFFVISGFIMWTIGRDAAPAPGRFLLRRAIRVAPPYWIATVAWVAAMSAIGANWISLDPGHVARSLLFVPHWSPTFPATFWPVLVPGWTLLFEMFFYAVFALCLVAAAGRARLALLVGALGALVAAGAALRPEAAPLVAYTSPLLLEFVGGCLVAEAWHRRPAGFGGAAGGAVAAAAGLGLLAWLGPGVVADQTSWGRPLVFGTAGILLVAGAVWAEARLPRWDWLERLGDASYAIYLFHLFVVVALAELWARLPDLHGGPGALGFVAVCLVLASLLGRLVFDWIERPLQKRLNALFQVSKRPAGPERARC